MNKKTTPAPRRAGTAKREALDRLQASLSRVKDPEALELIAMLIEKLAKRSRPRRR